MLNKNFRLALVVAGVTAAAWADSKPCLIKVIGLQAPWTVTKASPAEDGKCKIYDTEPVYSSLNNVNTREAKELKEEGATFTFKQGKNYWLVFYPKDRKVSVRLDFVKGRTDNKTTVTVNGTFALTKWFKGPETAIAYQNSSDKGLVAFDKANFGEGNTPKGKPEKVFLTLR
ncbi:MAG: hypothetical protein P4L36_20665 [Holophaga sp.]|nr:hypothetical protein [Holophaga sp.]